MDDACPQYMSCAAFYYVFTSNTSLSSKVQHLLAFTITLFTVLVDAIASAGLDLVEQAVACSRQLIDLLDRLAHAPSREPYRRVRVILIWLVLLSVSWALLVFVARVPMPAMHLQVAW